MTQPADPLTNPDAFLAALSAGGDPAPAAQAAGCVVHPLQGAGQPTALAALHAAGARALAASLPRGGAPMLLVLTPAPGPGYAPALAEGLMGYERIYSAQSPSAALILILPPVTVSSYWRK